MHIQPGQQFEFNFLLLQLKTLKLINNRPTSPLVSDFVFMSSSNSPVTTYFTTWNIYSVGTWFYWGPLSRSKGQRSMCYTEIRNFNKHVFYNFKLCVNQFFSIGLLKSSLQSFKFLSNFWSILLLLSNISGWNVPLTCRYALLSTCRRI